MQIYGLKNCDTCRKAIKALPHAVFFDVRSDGVPDDVLSRAHDQFGAVLLNSRSATWRGLSDKDKSLPALQMIRAHPAVMKRPLIVDEASMYLGWGPDVREKLSSS